MARKKRKKQPTLRSRIMSLIIERGPVELRDMTGILAARYQSLNTEALELRRLGVLPKDADAWKVANQEQRNNLARSMFQEVWIGDREIV